MYLAKVLADSISPTGVRLTTLEVEYPHAVHKDIMTHRMLSRNFQSFRAFPPEKVMENIGKDPFYPVFTKRVKGMANGVSLEGDELDTAQNIWHDHILGCLDRAQRMIDLDIGKDQVNFVLQDLTWIRGIITATDWDNFFALRAFAPDGSKPRPEVEKIAQMMYDAIDYSKPTELALGQWHMPLVSRHESVWCWEDNDTLEWDFWKKVSTGRCARVSYLTHDGKRDAQKDVGLHDGLLGNFHMSPFEHVATPYYGGNVYLGNFRGWEQYRKSIPNEANMMETYEGEVHPYWREEGAKYEV